ncbi:class I SAM-dependent methyltransferase [Kitasatospora sp. NPDC058965]|uniref:class I SAM-dependent methyltransferase n=1 Tax=Kitasatospora sp. NPDC058965 TaxID=3346682 RepID=UPI0036A3D3C6
MAERALSFGAMAQAYERHRPGYPAALLDLVTAYAGRPVRTALEIGAGTGKATRLFAAQGIAVTATEPDEEMLAELRKHVPATVRTERAAFEELRVGERYDLVYAAAALHWTRPAGRWPRMAELLVPDGVFASFGGPVELADPQLARAAEQAQAPYLDTAEIPSPDGTPPEQAMQWPGTELERSAWFTDVRQVEIPRRLTMTAAEYLDHLSTVSAYLVLSPADRAAAFRRIAGVLPATVELLADLTVHLARRSAEQGTVPR